VGHVGEPFEHVLPILSLEAEGETAIVGGAGVKLLRIGRLGGFAPRSSGFCLFRWLLTRLGLSFAGRLAGGTRFVALLRRLALGRGLRGFTRGCGLLYRLLDPDFSFLRRKGGEQRGTRKESRAAGNDG